MRFYVDTCIWLNLFKKEGDPSKGIPYWNMAQDFLKRTLFSEHQIVYSPIILRELQIKLENKDYQKARSYMEGLKLIKIGVGNDDLTIARQLESQYEFSISFYDLIHIALCKKHNLILITRDKKLSEISQANGVHAFKPEES